MNDREINVAYIMFVFWLCFPVLGAVAGGGIG